MSEYASHDAVERLIGPRTASRAKLIRKVRQQPFTVLLLDEIEKAHPDVFNLLLQVLEEGELKDNLGHTINFRNTVVIMTSNAGARLISRENRLGFNAGGEGILDYEEIRTSAMGELKRIFSPEFINRVDDIVVFNTLTREEVSAILDIQAGELRLRLGEQRIGLELKPGARNYLVDHGYDPAFGARPMRRLIQREIEDPLSLMIISGRLVPGDTVRVDSRAGKLLLHIRKEPKLPVAPGSAEPDGDPGYDEIPDGGSREPCTKGS